MIIEFTGLATGSHVNVGFHASAIAERLAKWHTRPFRIVVDIPDSFFEGDVPTLDGTFKQWDEVAS